MLTDSSFAGGQGVYDEISVELSVDVICVQIWNEMALQFTNDHASQSFAN